MKTLPLLSAVAGLASLSLASCAASSSKPLVAVETLEPYECGTVQKIHTLGGVFLASQPQPDDFKHAREGGIKTVINLRQRDEIDWDEAEVVTGLGMEYHHVPFRAPAELTDAVFDEVRVLLNDDSKKPVLLHCASANRVGAIWLAHRVLDGGLGFEAAYAEARTVGLKLPAYTERAREYVSRRQEGSR